MTGQNKFVVSVYEKMYMIEKGRLKNIFLYTPDKLRKQDILQCYNIGIPLKRENIKTKAELSEYVLKIVADYANSTSKNREGQRAYRRLSNRFQNEVGKIALTADQFFDGISNFIKKIHNK